MNVHLLVGRLGADPEFKTLDSGTAVASASLATSEFWMDKEGVRQERTTWHKLEAWGKTAELLSKAQKGSTISVEGSIKVDVVDKDDTKVYYTKTKINRMSFVGPKPPEASSGFDIEEEIPF